MTFSVLARLLQIQRVLVRHGLDEFIDKTHLLRPVRFFFFLSPAAWFERRRGGTRGERLRLALEELGPIFMKLGQVLSTRRDLLPPDIADELAKLQDRVPPFSSEAALGILADTYGRPASDVFASFDPQPLAAATIAQVHAATLKDGGANQGPDVVVKIVRPGIRIKIERDLEVMYTLAALALRYWSEGKRLRPTELVREYEKTILDELDMLREAGNASQLQRNFDGSTLLYVPKVHWEYCRKNVMVMERIEGVLISNIDELKRRNVNIQRLAENGVEIFFTQVFRHNFFHADMHPGNIFVLTGDPEQPRYAAVDFGIVGTLDPRDQYYLAENLLAFFAHDYRRIAQLHIDSAWVPTATRVDELESAVRTVCEPIFQKPLSEISFGQVLMGLFETARRFGISVQPQLLLLHKTLLQIEGLGRQLYPQLDLWKTAHPIMKNWMRKRMSPLGILKRLRGQMPDITETLNALPQLLQRAVQLANSGDMHVPEHHRDAEKMRAEIRASARRRDFAILSAAFIFGGMFWFMLVPNPLWPGALGLTAGLAIFWGSRRRGNDGM